VNPSVDLIRTGFPLTDAAVKCNNVSLPFDGDPASNKPDKDLNETALWLSAIATRIFSEADAGRADNTTTAIPNSMEYFIDKFSSPPDLSPAGRGLRQG
jgi:hypothetical protein